MKSFNDLEASLMTADEKIRSGISSVLNNMGRAVAIITALVTALVTFTDIAFSGAPVGEAIPSILLMLTSSYIIFFSLLDAGEKLGEEGEEYKRAIARYTAAKNKITGEDTEALRDFLDGYAREEYISRRSRLMLSLGISEEDIEKYKNKCRRAPREIRRAIVIISKIKPSEISLKSLMSSDTERRRGELENPARGRLPSLIVKLLPSTACMLVTVSLMLTLKDGMTAASVINSILKLSALPLIGFRGYSEGYRYVKGPLSLWLETKAGILESFLARKANK